MERSTQPEDPSAERTSPVWVKNMSLLLERRVLIGRVGAIAFVLGLAISCVIPKRYESAARIMPPEQSSSSAMMLAAIAGRPSGGGLGNLAGLAGNLFGARTTSALFVELLQSGTVTSHLIDRYNLQNVYGKKYRVDTAKALAKHTSISDDKRTGIITVKVNDTSKQRARDLAQGYLDELNQLVVQTNTSSARQERRFIEKRIASVRHDLEQAQLQLSDFSSTHTTIDIKEQTRATVEAGAKLQAEILMEESNLVSTKKIYGDGNIRVRAAQARLGSLHAELAKLSGNSASLNADESEREPDQGSTYPSLRQIPRLAVPYADLVRRVRVQETLFELLSQQYEVARVQEAKDVPVVSVIDAPGIPEKKSFPPRTLLTLGITVFALILAITFVLLEERWKSLDENDPRRLLGMHIVRLLMVKRSSLRGAE